MAQARQGSTTRTYIGKFYRAKRTKDGWWIDMRPEIARRFSKKPADTQPFGYYYPVDGQDAGAWVERILDALDSAFEQGTELVLSRVPSEGDAFLKSPLP